MSGERLGNWIIDRELGRGGMGIVYLAHAASADEHVAAVKVLDPTLARDEGFVARFRHESDALRQLDHPNIVHFYEAGEQDQRCFYAMEYVDGPSFEELLHARGRLLWPAVLDLALQVSLALKHAHDRGIIHRDLKPSNLLLARDDAPQSLAEPNLGSALGGLVKLTDFGIAKVFSATRLTATGGVIGTADYLSPEQAAGKPVTRRSDLYSLGVVLYTLLTGRTPFQGTTAVELLQKHRYGQFDRPQRLVPDLPHDLDRIVCQLLEKDPARRPADGMVLYRELDRVRRKLLRQQQEAVTLDAPTRTGPGETAPAERSEGPATLMSRLMRQELEAQKHGGPVKRFFNRPWVLVPLFLLTVGLLVWSLWPTSAETLYQRGVALMQSDNPDNWDQAEEHFQRLLTRDPNTPHRAEVEEDLRRIELWRAQRRAARKAGQTDPISEAQWFYEEGLRQQQRGDPAAAERTWRDLVTVFREVPSEQTWVLLARQQLERPNTRILPEEERWQPVRDALKQARALRDQGKQKEAEQIWQGLENLYSKDPSAAPLLEELRHDRAARG